MRICPPLIEKGNSDKICPRSASLTQESLDTCWMQYAVNLIASNTSNPFTSVIVNHEYNTLMCEGISYGENDPPGPYPGGSSPLYHGEISNLLNCSALYGPKCLNYSQMTMYSTGESCPMCISAQWWYGLSRNVYATSIQKLRCLGIAQLMMPDVVLMQYAEGSPPIEIVPDVLANITDPLFLRFSSLKALPAGWPASCQTPIVQGCSATSSPEPLP
ncbi:hypothetical protein CEUSTIGMA_g10403.t1 [Chlamydomonas eustigma]|uniref:Uncharacterized protein n=1 Tax=Chlamydomonas eustigma TaxID=1157962 RepID=A0A250XIY1_9CHLO|nr:hypothetical protein CEUSTIGMA_g10403.t1 [Chlamydomonas eustigma]|eukprot:GAX82976.1 hypothetical protein CEUSTIGMA_g10403.t1 [Chlamydomonas eustigma]